MAERQEMAAVRCIGPGRMAQHGAAQRARLADHRLGATM
jgi:hypothetical protein